MYLGQVWLGVSPGCAAGGLSEPLLATPYSVANFRHHLSHFYANVVFAILTCHILTSNPPFLKTLLTRIFSQIPSLLHNRF